MNSLHPLLRRPSRLYDDQSAKLVMGFPILPLPASPPEPLENCLSNHTFCLHMWTTIEGLTNLVATHRAFIKIHPECIAMRLDLNSCLLARGSLLMGCKNYKDAEADYNEVLKFEPLNATAMKFSGVILYQNGESDKAKIMLTAALKIAPDDSIIYGFLGYICVENNNIEQGMKYINAALKIDPANLSFLKYRAQLFVKLQKFNNAENDYIKYLEISSGETSIVGELANVFSFQNKYGAAVGLLREAVKYHPKNCDLLSILAKFLLVLDRDEESHDIFQLVYSINPDHQGVVVGLCLSSYQLKDQSYFKKSFEILKQGNPNDAGYDIFSAAMLAKDKSTFMKNKSKINQYYNNAQSKDPRSYSYACIVRIRFSLNMKEYKHVLDETSVSFRNNPKDFFAMKFRIKALIALKEYKEAIAYLDTYLFSYHLDNPNEELIVNLTPNILEAFILRAQVAFLLNKNDKHFVDLAKLIVIIPQNFDLPFALAKLNFEHKNYVSALTNFKIAIFIDSNSVVSAEYILKCFIELNLYEDAKELSNHFKVQFPNEPNLLLLDKSITLKIQTLARLEKKGAKAKLKKLVDPIITSSLPLSAPTDIRGVDGFPLINSPSPIDQEENMRKEGSKVIIPWTAEQRRLKEEHQKRRELAEQVEIERERIKHRWKEKPFEGHTKSKKGLDNSTRLNSDFKDNDSMKPLDENALTRPYGNGILENLLLEQVMDGPSPISYFTEKAISILGMTHQTSEFEEHKIPDTLYIKEKDIPKHSGKPLGSARVEKKSRKTPVTLMSTEDKDRIKKCLDLLNNIQLLCESPLELFEKAESSLKQDLAHRVLLFNIKNFLNSLVENEEFLGSCNKVLTPSTRLTILNAQLNNYSFRLGFLELKQFALHLVQTEIKSKLISFQKNQAWCSSGPLIDLNELTLFKADKLISLAKTNDSMHLNDILKEFLILEFTWKRLELTDQNFLKQNDLTDAIAMSITLIAQGFKKLKNPKMQEILSKEHNFTVYYEIFEKGIYPQLMIIACNTALDCQSKLKELINLSYNSEKSGL